MPKRRDALKLCAPRYAFALTFAAGMTDIYVYPERFATREDGRRQVCAWFGRDPLYWRDCLTFAGARLIRVYRTRTERMEGWLCC